MANEKRLIDADALMYSHWWESLTDDFDKARAKIILLSAPTVDAVEVVRCKDCIGKAHWYKNDYGCTICGLSGLFVVEDRDFCSYGERRTNEN